MDGHENPVNPQPRRQLHVGHAAAVCVGMVIGAGIFRTSPEVAAHLDQPATLMLAWAIGGILSLIGGLCFAEMSAAFPDTGGDYHFLRLAYGQRIAVLFAWSRFSVIHTGSIALLAFVFGDYLNQLIPLGAYGSPAFGALLITALVLMNLRGLSVGIGAQFVLMLLVLAGLVIVGFAGIHLATAGHQPLPPPADAVPVVLGVAGFGQAMVYVLLAYGGWSDAATLSAEMRDPKRGMPLALAGGLATVFALYLWVNWAYLQGLGFYGLAHSQAPAADLMRTAFGHPGEVVIVSIVAITSISVMNALLLAGSRTTYATARDLQALGDVGRWDGEKGVPRGAMIAMGAVSMLLVGFGTLTRGGFSTMVDYLSPVYWFFLMLSGIAVIRLRRRFPDAPRPFRVPWYPVLPLLFAASSAYLFYSSLAYVKLGAVLGVGVILLGALLLWPLMHWHQKRRTESLPEAERRP